MGLFSPATRRDPYPLYDQLRATTPVLHLPGPDLSTAIASAKTETSSTAIPFSVFATEPTQNEVSA